MFYYSVSFYLEDEPKKENGLLVGKTFAEAVTNLEGYYGNDLDEILYLVQLNDGSPVVCFPKTFSVDSQDIQDFKALNT